MWILESLIPGKPGEHHLLPNEKYLVGRKDCHILINENAVSRKHASITTGANPKTTGSPSISITDSSKFGTFVNNEKIKGPQELKDGDEIYFGHISCKYRLKSLTLIATSSCISDLSAKRNLQANLQKLGGQLVNEWNENCSHLVMEKITFTIKVVCALLHCRPIVTPEYFQKMMEAVVQGKGSCPSHENFMPEVGEALLKGREDLFSNDVARRKLFQGKNFFTLSKKQFKRLNQVIVLAGGSLDIVEEGDSNFLKVAVNGNSVVVNPEPKDEASKSEAQQQFTKTTRSALKRHGLRMVKESEVGLAIFMKSLEKFCNMKASEASLVNETSLYMNTCPTSSLMNETQSQFLKVYESKQVEEKQSMLDESRNVSSHILAEESQASPRRKRRRSSGWDRSVIGESIDPNYSETEKETMIPNDNDDDFGRKETSVKVQKQKEENLFARKSSTGNLRDVAKEEKNASDDMDTVYTKAGCDDELPAKKARVETKTNEVDRKIRNERANVEHMRGGIFSEMNVKKEADMSPSLNTNLIVDNKPLSQNSQQPIRREIAQDKALPSEFLTTRLKVKRETTDEQEVPANVINVQFVSLVVRTGRKANGLSADTQWSNKKNFKKFSKTSYPGKDRGIPRIIGGEDLVPYQKDDMTNNLAFAEIREEEKRHNEEERYLDRLFNFGEKASVKQRRLR